ncbi:DNA primase [Sphingomonas antarctica]|uniref:DNA primase n=1 Tax=Sphingomonas antarctica TaxID=2040274 RepID=UPI0039EA642E
MSLSPAFLDELRTRTLLSALVGKTVKLQRAGREWRACCPFHDEKTPSFYVNDSKGFYHCFGCSAHGDAIRWLTDQRGLPFMDAVKELANAASMDLPAPDPREAQRQERAAGLHDAMAAAEAWFIEQLNGVEGGEARAYLKTRNISPELAAKFGIGLAPDSRGRLRSALTKFGDPMLVECGLLIAVDDKEPYDRFRGRLMIPIRDPRGRTIAFGGRILGAGEPKYLNSPDTPLFDKGRTLWNLDKAAGASRKAGRLIVVEGYMDAIALAGAGIEEVVAPNGTALTEHQIERLWSLIDVPVVCFDGDSAGQKAASRAAYRALPILRPGCSLAFATLPPGQDPDDLVRAGGAAAFEPVIAAAEAMIDRLWTSEQAATSLATPEARAGLKQRLDALVDTIGDPEVRRHYQRQLKERFDERFFARREFVPRGQFAGKGKPVAGPASPSAQAIYGRGIEPVYERPIMAGLVRHPSIVMACAETLGMLRLGDQRLDALRATLVDAAYDGDLVDSAQLDPICASAGLTDMLAELRAMNGRRGMAFSFLKRSTPEEAARRDLAMTIEAVAARPEIDQALQAATDRVGMGGGEDCFEEQLRLLRAKHDNEQQMRLLLGQDDGI